MTASVDVPDSDGRPVVEAETPPRRLAYAWYVVFVLMLGYTVSLIDRQILSLMVGPVRADLGLTDTQLSVLHGLAFALFYTGFGIPLGWLADHWNRRNLLIIGIFGWGTATAACGLAASFGELFLARMAVGLGEAALAPAAYSLIHNYFPASRRGLAISLFGGGATLGASLAYIVGGNAVAYGATGAEWLQTFGLVVRPWQFVFFAVSVPAFIVMALFFTIREPARAPAPKARLSSILDGVREMWTQRHWFGPPVMALSLAAIVLNGIYAWVPSHFIRVFDWRPDQIGMAFGLILLTCGLSGMWTGGILSDRLMPRQGLSGIVTMMLIAEGVAGLAAAIFGFVNTPAFALLILAVAVFAFGTAIAVGPLVIQSIAGERIRGQSIAVSFFLINLFGLGLGPTLIAVCSDYILRDEVNVGKSVGVIALLVMPVVLWLLHIGRRRLRVFTGPAS